MGVLDFVGVNAHLPRPYAIQATPKWIPPKYLPLQATRVALPTIVPLAAYGRPVIQQFSFCKRYFEDVPVALRFGTNAPA